MEALVNLWEEVEELVEMLNKWNKVQIRSYSSNLESCDHCGRITETNDSYTFLEYTTDSDSDSYIEDSYVSALEQSQVKKRLT